MAKANVRREDKGPGADYINDQRAVDEAINERLKAESEADKLDPRSANNPSKTEYKPEDEVKKSGRTKE